MKKIFFETILIAIISSTLQLVYRNFRYLIEVIKGNQIFSTDNITWSCSIIVASIILFWLWKFLYLIQKSPNYDIDNYN